MKRYNKEDYIGETKGIYTFLGMVSNTKGIFKCELCGNKYEGSFYN